ncbi:MAG: hypothetical protein BRD55_00850 [Bacteroidetes bacterium SW_9_63_38]|nr:MAG: hypothetical protein BRD55_00850 [Bacteroidetes bacterium SW_9_63_38]
MPASSPEPPPPSSLPTTTDLDELSTKLRDVARQHDLSARLIERYEKWSFLFLGWCLQVPPYQIHQDRIGDFWHALNHRAVDRGEIYLAMDALGFFFGSLSDNVPLSFSATPPPENDDEDAVSDATAEGLRAPLPEGPLPESIDVPSVVPTQSSSDPSSPLDEDTPAPAPESSREDPPSFWTLLKSEEEDNPFEKDDVSSPSDENTVPVDLPEPVVNRMQAMAQRRDLSMKALITKLLDSAQEEAESSSSPVHA